MTYAGALVFGLVVGFLTYRTLIRTVDKAAVTDLVAVLGAIGGGTVTKLYDASGVPFAWYAIGLALGMASFFLLYARMNSRADLAKVMSGKDVTIGGTIGGAQPARPDNPRPPDGPRA